MATLIPVAVNPTGPGFTQATAADTLSIPGSIALPSMTQGSVIFAGAAGALAQDNANLFWDDTNNSLGVGTAAPGVNTVSIVQPVKTTGSPVALRVAGGAHTTLAATVEAPDVSLALARTVQFATGAIAAQRAVLIDRPKYAFVGASVVTECATVAIVGAPSAHTNATLTQSSALYIGTNDTTDAGAVTRSYGFYCNTQSGATANYAAAFMGGYTGVGTATPTATVHVVQAIATGGSPNALTVAGGAHTTLTAATEASDVFFNLARTVQFTTGADLTMQRAVQIAAPTYAMTAATGTITEAATFAVSGGPVEGANCDLKLSYGILVQGGAVGTCDSGYGIRVIAPTGATNNYAAWFSGGNVGFGATSTTTYVNISEPTRTTSSPSALVVVSGKHTTLTAATEAKAVYFNFTEEVEFTAGAAITLQRAFAIQGPTYKFTAPSTITDAATLALTGAPIAKNGAATITRTHGILVSSVDVTGGAVGIVGTSYGLTVNAQTGATANYAAQFMGGYVGVATATPDAFLTVNPVATANGATALRVSSGIHTASTLGTEKPQVLLEGGGREWATGALAAQRAIKITAAAAYFVGGSTLTDAATVGITGAYAAGTNATITRSHGLWIESNNVNTIGVAVTAAYGLTVNAPTGATNNYAAQFVGASGTQGVVVLIQETAAASGAVAALGVIGAAKTGQTATTEIAFVTIQPSTREWASGNVSFQREVKITQPSYSFDGASVMTDGATFSVEGAPKSEANATITNSHGIYVRSFDVTGAGACGNSYGLTVNAMTGATANYAAQFLGGATIGVVVNPGTTPQIGVNLDIAVIGGAVDALRDSHTLTFRSQGHVAGAADHYGVIHLDAYGMTYAGQPGFRIRDAIDTDTLASSYNMVQISRPIATSFTFLLNDGGREGDTCYVQPAPKLAGTKNGDTIYISGGDSIGADHVTGSIYVNCGALGTDSTTYGEVLIGTLYTGVHVHIAHSGGLLGFYGGGPTVQQVLAADPTAAEISTVLHTLGLVS